MVVYTDASGVTGWGASVGDKWLQGTWPGHEASKSINWKELRTYALALSTLRDELANKLAVVRMDNACAVHYVNCGTGRVEDLSQLGREIKLLEVRLGIESVAIHLPGKLNITADALSRLHLRVDVRDKHGDRCLRRKLFDDLNREHGPFMVDAFAADDGHNKPHIVLQAPDV